MNRIFYLATLLFLTFQIHAQTCTIAVSGTWSTRVCQETGLAPTAGATIVVNAGVTLSINNSASNPIHTGNLIILGTVINDKANAVWNGNITIAGTGTLELKDKFDIGSVPDCGFSINVESGGKLILSGSGGSDLLSICDKRIAQTGGSCNSCGGTNSGTCAYTGQPYCEPPGGFTGPIGFNQGGFAPVNLIYFTSSRKETGIHVIWATSKEENFSHFVVEHSMNGVDFTTLGEVPGAGYNTESVVDYSYTHKVPKIGYNYYRLKAVDLDGTFEYFGPIGERFRGEQLLWIYPNPAAGDKINYEVNFAPNESDRVQIYNQMGLLVADLPAVVHPGSVYLQEALKPGAYVLRYSTSTGVLAARFIVLK